MTTYEYTIFDDNPSISGSCSWPSHESVEIRAMSAENALRRALAEARREGKASGEYARGERLWAIVWGPQGSVQGSVAM